MTIEQTSEIYETISSTKLDSLLSPLLEIGVRYARIRVDWLLASQENRQEMEKTRTRTHTAFIDACNILSRNMHEAGENNNWRALIGEDRKTIGDFACHLHCLLGIMAR
jgi:hypothetical protein